MIERHLDYMQFSALVNERNMAQEQYEPVHPVKFYSRGYRHPLGYRLYFGNPKSKKALIVASAEALANMRGENMLDAEILQYGLSLGANFTRLDLAVTEWNTFDGMITVGDVECWAKQGLIESTLVSGGVKTISEVLVGGSNVVQTLYVGSMSKRGKRGIFRAYDKGIELDLGEYMATRLELEERGEKAHNTALRLADTNDISGNFRARFNVKHRDFDRLMEADAVDISRGKQKAGKEASEENDDRWAWLMNQVAPALKKAYQADLKDGLGTNRLNQFLIKSGLGKPAARGIVDNATKSEV